LASLAVAFLDPIEGSAQVARAWIEIANRLPSTMKFLECTVNGQPGLVAQDNGETVTVFAFNVTAGRIKHLGSTQPRKAPSVERVGDGATDVTPVWPNGEVPASSGAPHRWRRPGSGCPSSAGRASTQSARRRPGR